MNNALYKCCIITHCAVSHKDQIKKWYHRFIFHFFDLVEGGGVQVGGVLRGGGRWVGGRWCVREVGGRDRHQIEQNWRIPIIYYTIVQSWLIYRRHSDDMGTSRKEEFSLLDFKLDIAAYLRVKSEPGVKRKGRPIVKPSST